MDIKKIEKYWQLEWENQNVFSPVENSKKPKYFNFDSAPFPNGELHLGHLRNYVLGDIQARYQRLKGANVLYTTNFDSFGLPNQIEAEKRSKSPQQHTHTCIELIKNDLQRLGISYDWGRVNSTSTPQYYHWTQWLFLELYSAGLIYRKKSDVNWCENCQSVLANLEVEAGCCHRCQSDVEQKNMPQWFIALSQYSPELNDSLEQLTGWSKRAKKWVKGFIGKTPGSIIKFSTADKKAALNVFVPEGYSVADVMFVAACADSPEIMALQKMLSIDSMAVEGADLTSATKRRRKHGNDDRAGIDSGIKLIHPVSGVLVPLYFVNYLSAETGPPIKAGVPLVNKVDAVFAEKNSIPVFPVSERELNHIEHVVSEKKDYYHVHDWMVSRQKSWGTPLPMLECDRCGFVPVQKKDLPLKNIYDQPESGSIQEFNCPECNQKATPVADTLDCYIDDVWCFLSAELSTDKTFSLENASHLKWFPADHYHAGFDIYMYLHLYRFIGHFLYKQGYTKTPEPIVNYFGHDMVLQDGKKMSKRHRNSQSIRSLLDEYGADIIRVAMVLAANPDRPVRWSEEGLIRSEKIVFKLHELASLILKPVEHDIDTSDLDEAIKKKLENSQLKLKKEMARFIESYRPGSALQALEKQIKEVSRIFNLLEMKCLSIEDAEYLKQYLRDLCIVYSPFAPHVAEEVWRLLGGDGLLSQHSAESKWLVDIGA